MARRATPLAPMYSVVPGIARTTEGKCWVSELDSVKRTVGEGRQVLEYCERGG